MPVHLRKDPKKSPQEKSPLANGINTEPKADLNQPARKNSSLHTFFSDLSVGMRENLREKSGHFDPLSQSIHRSLKNDLDCLIEKLHPRERMVIKLRFGLDGHKSHRLVEIGKQLNLTRERVGQILENAFMKLKSSHRGKSLSAYLKADNPWERRVESLSLQPFQPG